MHLVSLPAIIMGLKERIMSYSTSSWNMIFLKNLIILSNLLIVQVFSSISYFPNSFPKCLQHGKCPFGPGGIIFWVIWPVNVFYTKIWCQSPLRTEGASFYHVMQGGKQVSFPQEVLTELRVPVLGCPLPGEAQGIFSHYFCPSTSRSRATTASHTFPRPACLRLPARML